MQSPFALLLLVLLSGLLWFPPPPKNQNGSRSLPRNQECQAENAATEKARLLNHSNPDDAARAVIRWKCLSSQLRRPKIDNASPSPSIRPAGDLCGMRYKGYFNGLDRSVYRHFAIIAFSNDPNYQLQKLLELQQTHRHEPRIAHRAAVGRVYVALRANRGKDALMALKDAKRWDRNVPRACRADLAFLRGVLSERKGNDKKALENYYDAITLDENFWNAHSRLLRTIYHRLTLPFKTNASCLDTTRLFLIHLRKMQNLGQNRSQFIELAELLASKGGAGSAAANLVLAHIYAWNNAPKETRLYAEKVLSNTPTLPEPCDNLLKQQALSLIEPQKYQSP